MTSHTVGAGASKGGEAVKLILSLTLLLTLFLAGTATPADAQSTTTTEPVTTTATDTPSPSTTTTVTPPPDTTTTAAATTGAAGSTTSPTATTTTGTTVSSNSATPASSLSPTTTTSAAGTTTTTTAPSTTGGGTSSSSPTATATGAPTTLAPAATPSTESDQSIQWYHVTVGVLGLFVIVGGACYVTLMWQQNAIRNYKNNFEEMVKKIGLKRNNLAEALRRERDNADAVRRPDMALEDVRAVTAVGDDAASPVAGPGAAGSGVGASASGGAGGGAGGGLGEHGSANGALLSAPTLGVGKLHTYQARTARMAKEEEARAARALEVQLLRQHREEELGRRRAAAGSDLLSQAVFEAVGVDRSIELVERRAQWRSLRSLDLGE